MKTSKIKSFLIKSSISIIGFVLIIYLSFTLAPFLITAQHYKPNAIDVHSSFPIAVQNENIIDIVTWKTYINSPKSYATKLLLNPEKTKYTLPDNQYLNIEVKHNNNYKITYYADDYTFWSEYTVVNNQVIPTYFRFTGAFIVMPVFFTSLLFIIIINAIFKYYLDRRSKKTAAITHEL